MDGRKAEAFIDSVGKEGGATEEKCSALRVASVDRKGNRQPCFGWSGFRKNITYLIVGHSLENTYIHSSLCFSISVYFNFFSVWARLNLLVIAVVISRDPYEFSESDSDTEDEEDDKSSKKKKKKKKVGGNWEGKCAVVKALTTNKTYTLDLFGWWIEHRTIVQRVVGSSLTGPTFRVWRESAAFVMTAANVSNFMSSRTSTINLWYRVTTLVLEFCGTLEIQATVLKRLGHGVPGVLTCPILSRRKWGIRSLASFSLDVVLLIFLISLQGSKFTKVNVNLSLSAYGNARRYLSFNLFYLVQSFCLCEKERENLYRFSCRFCFLCSPASMTKRNFLPKRSKRRLMLQKRLVCSRCILQQFRNE